MINKQLALKFQLVEPSFLLVIDPQTFLDKFGAPVEQLEQLVSAKTVTIARLMEIVPPGTIDPTPSLYNTTMYAMAALLAIAFVSNLLIGPVDKKHHMKE